VRSGGVHFGVNLRDEVRRFLAQHLKLIRRDDSFEDEKSLVLILPFLLIGDRDHEDIIPGGRPMSLASRAISWRIISAALDCAAFTAPTIRSSSISVSFISTRDWS